MFAIEQKRHPKILKESTQNFISVFFCILTFFFLFFSCSQNIEYEFNADFNSALEEDTSTTVYFFKEQNSSSYFTRTYKIGKIYTSENLPNLYDDDVWDLNPGYDLGGWRFGGLLSSGSPQAVAGEFVSTDSNGYVSAIKAIPEVMFFYGDDYTPSSRTPYTLCFMTQNLALDDYDFYSSKTLYGTTGGYTDGLANLTSISGFEPSASVSEQEILADGSTKVYAYYDRKNTSITVSSVTPSYLKTVSGTYGLEITEDFSGLVRDGYEISSWKRTAPDSSETTVSSLPKTYPEQNYTYSPNWTAQKVSYKVIHKTQNITMDGYDIAETQTLYGYTDSQTQAVAKSYTGFELNSAPVQTLIFGDGSTEVTVLYDRKIYSLTMYGNGGDNAGVDSNVLGMRYGVAYNLMANNFTRTGYTFKGWATTKARADSGTVDYENLAEYTIGAADAALYAVWTANQISVDVTLLGDDGVGISCEVEGNLITFAAVIPQGYSESDFTYSWFFTNTGLADIKSTASSWVLDTSSFESGYYQISLLAVKTEDGSPSGGTVQIEVN